MIGHDQKLLNATLKGDWAELSPDWNWQYTRATHALRGDGGRATRAFHRPQKPWGHERRGAAAAVPRGLPRVLRARISRSAGRRRTGRRRSEPRLPAAECSVRHLRRGRARLRPISTVSRPTDGAPGGGADGGRGPGSGCSRGGGSTCSTRRRSTSRSRTSPTGSPSSPAGTARRAASIPIPSPSIRCWSRRSSAGSCRGPSRAGGWRRCCTTRRNT